VVDEAGDIADLISVHNQDACEQWMHTWQACNDGQSQIAAFPVVNQCSNHQ
jgi:hypothetical protein